MRARLATTEDRSQLIGLVEGYFDFYQTPFPGAAQIGALLAAARRYAAESGYARLDWVTGADNLAAQRFYDRHGGRRGPWISYSLPVR
ncbi:MAG: hypothetical protein M3Z11_05655 [Candidatus Dormibacteraeota bacterium]|nr:hypothetical protein [Candidatus Dormibacteraeota bacterium]